MPATPPRPDTDPTGPVHSATPYEPAADFMLAPATRLLWRSHHEVQLERDDDAVLVEGLPVDVIRRIADSSRPGEHRPRAVPDSDENIRQAVRQLADAGFLWPRSSAVQDARLLPPAPALAGELTALSARFGESAAQVLSTRRHARVEVCGPGRAAVAVAHVLAAAGVGHLHCNVSGTVNLAHVTPGGVSVADEGRPLAEAAGDVLRGASPTLDMSAFDSSDPPDLTVLAVDAPVTEDRRAALHAGSVTHLPVSLHLGRAQVGPLVVPGHTSCLRCADLHRRDRDPAWPALAVQLSVGRRYGPASETALTTLAIGLAAAQVLAYLDGDEPATVQATLECQLPDWRVRRRQWPRHTDCDCAMSAAGWAQWDS